MAKPTEAAWQALKRLCRYLVGLPRLIMHFKWQEVSGVDVYTDTDWAGCPRTRKSTSGGCVILGAHPVKSWSSTQTSVALSSGEAEFNGVVRGAGVGLGCQSLLRDFGISLPVRIWTDSSAAIGICTRQGLGKLRHLDTHTLWVQQAVRTGRIDLRKVAGEVNPADLFTKHSLTRERMRGLVGLFDCSFRGGRAESAPQTRVVGDERVIMAEAHSVCAATISTTAPGQARVASVHASNDETIFPHIVYGEDELNELYPSITAPEAVDAEDPQDQARDPVLEAGLRCARDLVQAGREQGLRRRLKPHPYPNAKVVPG